MIAPNVRQQQRLRRLAVKHIQCCRVLASVLQQIPKGSATNEATLDEMVAACKAVDIARCNESLNWDVRVGAECELSVPDLVARHI